MDNLLKYIRSLTNFSDKSWELLQPALLKQEFKKKELLLKQGQVCNSLFYIDKGYCKSYQATSGRVTGVLSKSERNRPSTNGTVIYINASPGIQTVLDKVEQAGGKIITPKIEIPAGFIAIIMDSEGNKVGLHSEQ